VRTLLLGLGNELYGDDGVGIAVVKALRKDIKKKKKLAKQFADVKIEECCLSGMALLDVIVGYDRLILVDTIKRKAPLPGRVHLLRPDQIRAIPGPSPHYVSIPQTIEIGRKLGLCVPSKIVIIAIEAKNTYSLGEGLSEEMKEKIPDIIQKVRDALAGE
jgi:hydrogenase maturation protease